MRFVLIDQAKNDFPVKRLWQPALSNMCRQRKLVCNIAPSITKPNCANTASSYQCRAKEILR